MSIVTISRGTFSGGEALAHLLSERLGFRCLSREVIRDAASRHGIAENLLDKQLTEIPAVFQRRLVGKEEHRLYLIAIQAELAEKAKEGNLIYHGHAGHLLLRGMPNVLRVRLLGDMAYRIDQVKEKRGLNEADARKYIDLVDRSRIRWTRFLYDVDWRDPHLYDLVIQLKNLSLETACEMILATLQQPEFQDSPEKQKIIDQFVLGCRIKLRLAQDERTRGMHLHVSVADQVAEISGKFLNNSPVMHGTSRSENDILAVTREFPEIQRVDFVLKDAAVAIGEW